MHSKNDRSSLLETFSTPWIHAGGSPAATYFLLLRQKKVSKEKATAKPLPSLRSGPQMWRVPVGWEDQLAALRHVFPQFPTDTHHIWQRPNAEFTSTATATSKTTSTVIAVVSLSIARREYFSTAELFSLYWDFLLFQTRRRVWVMLFRGFALACFIAESRSI